MDSYAERQARVNQRFEDLKITIFQATGDFSLWCGVLTSALVPLAQIAPALTLLHKAFLAIKALRWASMWEWIQRAVYASRLQIMFMNRELITGQFASNGFLINITRATLAVVRFATVGIFNALKGIGALVLSFVTGGAASAGFAATASAAFGTFSATATTACRAVSVAISSIPIIGWIAAAIAALIAIGAYFWNTSAKFRAVLKGTWAAFKACFSGIGELARQTFGAIGDLIKAAFSLDATGIDAALKKLKAGFSDYGKQVGQAFNEAYDAEMTESAKKEGAKNPNGKKPGPNTSGAVIPEVTVPTVNPTGTTLSGATGTGGSGSGSDSGGKIKNITINIEKLVERFEIHSATVGESAEQVKAIILETLMGALNDTQLTTT